MIIKNSTYDIQPNSVKLLNRSLYQSNNKININSKVKRIFKLEKYEIFNLTIYVI